jgi:hypothetical protein
MSENPLRPRVNRVALSPQYLRIQLSHVPVPERIQYVEVVIAAACITYRLRTE